MDLYSHYGRLLGIGEEWKVTDVNLDMAHLKVDIIGGVNGLKPVLPKSARIGGVNGLKPVLPKSDIIGGVNGLKPVLPENYNHKPN